MRSSRSRSAWSSGCQRQGARPDHRWSKVVKEGRQGASKAGRSRLRGEGECGEGGREDDKPSYGGARSAEAGAGAGQQCAASHGLSQNASELQIGAATLIQQQLRALRARRAKWAKDKFFLAKNATPSTAYKPKSRRSLTTSHSTLSFA